MPAAQVLYRSSYKTYLSSSKQRAIALCGRSWWPNPTNGFKICFDRGGFSEIKFYLYSQILRSIGLRGGQHIKKLMFIE